jgi:hypothetical protein
MASLIVRIFEQKKVKLSDADYVQLLEPMNRLMNIKHTLVSLVTGAMLMGTAAIAAQGHDQPRAKSHARVTKPTAVSTTTRVGGNTGAIQTRQRFATGGNSATIATRDRTRFATGGNSATIGTRNRVVTRSSSYPYRSYGYRSYGYGYPYYSYGYGYPSYGYYPYSGFSFGYYPYDYGYPSDYSYGYYYNTRPAYGTYANDSVVAQVQARLAAGSMA